MLRSKKFAQALLWGGLVTQLIAVAALTSIVHPSTLGFSVAIVAVIATIVYVAGLSLVAFTRGHHPAWGLLGLLSVAGIMIVLGLPELE